MAEVVALAQKAKDGILCDESGLRVAEHAPALHGAVVGIAVGNKHARYRSYLGLGSYLGRVTP